MDDDMSALQELIEGCQAMDIMTLIESFDDMFLPEKAAVELAAIQADRDEAIIAAKMSVSIGQKQVAEWDKFWEAMGVRSAQVTIDQAIEKYKALQAENARLTAGYDALYQKHADLFEPTSDEIKKGITKRVGER